MHSVLRNYFSITPQTRQDRKQSSFRGATADLRKGLFLDMTDLDILKGVVSTAPGWEGSGEAGEERARGNLPEAPN